MDKSENSPSSRVVHMKRELMLWRVLALAITLVFALAFAQEKQQKEIRLASADGRQVMVLSSRGIELSDKGKMLGQIGFETIGDGEEQDVLIELSGQISATRVFVEEEKNRLSLRATGVAFAEGFTQRAMFTPDALSLQASTGHSKIILATPSQGVGGLDFVEDGKLILGLGPVAKFRGGNLPRRDSGAIHIGDFGPDPKTRLITASESQLHTTH